ncbi:MAG: hypothetical protein K1W40_17650, partial [Schaedlerella sp.]|uniref:hypothetical protein n=1 Tax=Schaedlerella sp. TaxID=2676057 RepID=UPI0035276026
GGVLLFCIWTSSAAGHGQQGKYQQRIRVFIAFLKEIVDKKGLSVKNNGIMQEKNEFIWKKLSLFHCFTVMKD